MTLDTAIKQTRLARDAISTAILELNQPNQKQNQFDQRKAKRALSEAMNLLVEAIADLAYANETLKMEETQ